MKHKGRIWIEHCASSEWGNRIMQEIAKERFAKDPSLDVVEVYEHAGWSLAWNRDGEIVASANDMAWFPQSVRDWAALFSGFEHVGYTRRDDGIDQRCPNYFPALAAVA